MSVPDPTLMGWGEWAAEMTVRFPSDRLGNWPWHDWKDWGLQLFFTESFSDVNIPDPLAFGDDWKEWATRLKQAVET